MKKMFYFILIGLCLLQPAFESRAEAPAPLRIVSLGAYLTEGLFLLGEQDNIVGVTTYCNRPEEAKQKEKAGTIVDVNVEKVVALAPDLILATPLTNTRDKDKLKALGFNVQEFGQVSDFEQICAQFIDLGKMVKKETEAIRIVNQARQQVALITSELSGKTLKKVFIQVGTKPLFTMNKEFYINDIIKKAKGINIAADDATGIYSREKVIQADPDIIIITSMGLAAEDERKAWAKYKTIEAVKNSRIFTVDPDIICNPLPGNFAQALRKVSDYLHGK